MQPRLRGVLAPLARDPVNRNDEDLASAMTLLQEVLSDPSLIADRVDSEREPGVEEQAQRS